MPFRARFKRALGRPSVSSPSTDTPSTNLKQTSTATSSKSLKQSKTSSKWRFGSGKKEDEYADWPENIYRPHEMPRPKYRQPPDKKHSERLQAFSFGSAINELRRRSGVSLYSPMGSRMPSRGGSLASKGGGKSAGPSRNQSVADPVQEIDGDDDVANVGLSRQPTQTQPRTKEPPISHPPTSDLDPDPSIPRPLELSPGSSSSPEADDGDTLATSKTITQGNISRADTRPPATDGGMPFSEEELARALQETRLEGRGGRMVGVGA